MPSRQTFPKALPISWSLNCTDLYQSPSDQAARRVIIASATIHALCRLHYAAAISILLKPMTSSKPNPGDDGGEANLVICCPNKFEVFSKTFLNTQHQTCKFAWMLDNASHSKLLTCCPSESPYIRSLDLSLHIKILAGSYDLHFTIRGYGTMLEI